MQALYVKQTLIEGNLINYKLVANFCLRTFIFYKSYTIYIYVHITQIHIFTLLSHLFTD